MLLFTQLQRDAVKFKLDVKNHLVVDLALRAPLEVKGELSAYFACWRAVLEPVRVLCKGAVPRSSHGGLVQLLQEKLRQKPRRCGVTLTL